MCDCCYKNLQDPEREKLIMETIEHEYQNLGPIRSVSHFTQPVYVANRSSVYLSRNKLASPIAFCFLFDIRFPEVAAGTMFVLLVFLCFFRSPGFMPGWGGGSVSGRVCFRVSPTRCRTLQLYLNARDARIIHINSHLWIHICESVCDNFWWK